MAELSIPYAQRKLARPAPGGGGGRGAGGIAQPTVPDVSKMYAPLQRIGGEFEDITSELGRVAAQRQKARDVATLTEFESGINEALGVKAEELKADQRIHPDDYYNTMAVERQKIIDERLQDMPGRLQGLAKGKAIGGTERLMIGMKAEGTKRALERYTNAYDLYMDQQERDYLNTTDQKARDEIGVKMRTKTEDYILAGTFSPDQAAIKLREARDRIEYAGLESYAIHQPEAFLREEATGLLQNLPGDKRTKLIDKAQEEQRQGYQMAEARQQKLDRETRAAQKETFAVAFGQIQQRQLNEAGLAKMRDQRTIGDDDYKEGMRYLDHMRRSDAADARARTALGLQQAEAKKRETDANLTIQARLGATPEQLLDYARANKLAPTAYDSAIAAAVDKQRADRSEHGSRHNQAEQMLRSKFIKPDLSLFPGVTEQQYADALTELTERSKAYKTGREDRDHTEDPLAIVDEITAKYKRPAFEADKAKARQLEGFLEFRSMPDLEAAKDTLPPWKYKEQKRWMLELNTVSGRLQEQMALEEAAGLKARQDAETQNFISRWWYGPPIPGQKTPKPGEGSQIPPGGVTLGQ